jgi:rRNA-processing protein FCF1
LSCNFEKIILILQILNIDKKFTKEDLDILFKEKSQTNFNFVLKVMEKKPTNQGWINFDSEEDAKKFEIYWSENTEKVGDFPLQVKYQTPNLSTPTKEKIKIEAKSEEKQPKKKEKAELENSESKEKKIKTEVNSQKKKTPKKKPKEAENSPSDEKKNENNSKEKETKGKRQLFPEVVENSSSIPTTDNESTDTSNQAEIPIDMSRSIKVKISNIDRNITEEMLNDIFEGNKKIALNETDDVSNHAYIEFSSLELAESMLNRFNGKTIGSGSLEVVCELIPLETPSLEEDVSLEKQNNQKFETPKKEEGKKKKKEKKLNENNTSKQIKNEKSPEKPKFEKKKEIKSTQLFKKELAQGQSKDQKNEGDISEGSHEAFIIFDTNSYLNENLNSIRQFIIHYKMKIVVPLMVSRELDSLKNDPKKNVSTKARDALKFMERLLSEKLLFVDRDHTKPIGNFGKASSDDYIAGCTIWYVENSNLRVYFISGDTALRLKLKGDMEDYVFSNLVDLKQTLKSTKKVKTTDTKIDHGKKEYGQLFKEEITQYLKEKNLDEEFELEDSGDFDILIKPIHVEKKILKEINSPKENDPEIIEISLIVETKAPDQEVLDCAEVTEENPKIMILEDLIRDDSKLESNVVENDHPHGNEEVDVDEPNMISSNENIPESNELSEIIELVVDTDTEVVESQSIDVDIEKEIEILKEKEIGILKIETSNNESEHITYPDLIKNIKVHFKTAKVIDRLKFESDMKSIDCKTVQHGDKFVVAFLSLGSDDEDLVTKVTEYIRNGQKFTKQLEVQDPKFRTFFENYSKSSKWNHVTPVYEKGIIIKGSVAEIQKIEKKIAKLQSTFCFDSFEMTIKANSNQFIQQRFKKFQDPTHYPQCVFIFAPQKEKTTKGFQKNDYTKTFDVSLYSTSEQELATWKLDVLKYESTSTQSVDVPKNKVGTAQKYVEEMNVKFVDCECVFRSTIEKIFVSGLDVDNVSEIVNRLHTLLTGSSRENNTIFLQNLDLFELFKKLPEYKKGKTQKDVTYFENANECTIQYQSTDQKKLDIYREYFAEALSKLTNEAQKIYLPVSEGFYWLLEAKLKKNKEKIENKSTVLISREFPLIILAEVSIGNTKIKLLTGELKKYQFSFVNVVPADYNDDNLNFLDQIGDNKKYKETSKTKEIGDLFTTSKNVVRNNF